MGDIRYILNLFEKLKFKPTNTLAASVPSDTVSIVMLIALIVKDKVTPTTNDAAWKTWLESFGYTVTYEQDDIQDYDPTDYDLIFISDSIFAFNTAWLKDKDVPIITTERLDFPYLDLGTGSNDKSDDQVVIDDNTNYITSIYNEGEVVTISDDSDKVSAMTGWSNDVQALVTAFDTPTEGIILFCEKGDTLADSSVAAGKRLFFGGDQYINLTEDGKTLLSRSILFMTGNTSGSFIADNEGQIISKFVVGVYTGPNYWTDWGGNYDGLPISTEIIVFFKQFLRTVNNGSTLISTLNSMYVDGRSIYINTPIYPWQYFFSQIQVRGSDENLVGGYATAARSDEAQRHSDDSYFNSSLDRVRYPALLSVPRGFINKLPAAVYGINLSTTFSVKLDNSDGRFDLTEDTDFFNTPAQIKKSTVDDPKLDTDFKVIKSGLVEDISITFDKATFKIADVYRTFNEEVAEVLNIDRYPAIESDKIGKKIPVAWGEISKMELIKVSQTSNRFIAIDHKYFTDCTAVYDGDGNEVSFTLQDEVIITSGANADDAETADVIGRIDNRIGIIITSIAEEVSLQPYSDDFWDVAETDVYIANSPRVNFVFAGGTVRSLISSVQKSDNAFLLAKNNGLLTLRRFGDTYESFAFESWEITKKPKKKFSNEKFFLTSVLINYSGGTLEDTSRENEISEQSNKLVRKDFDTTLSTEDEALAFAQLLYARYGRRSEQWSLSIGSDTSEINPLDKINLIIDINGRKMSNVENWIVTSVDPSQDTLILEEDFSL